MQSGKMATEEQCFTIKTTAIDYFGDNDKPIVQALECVYLLRQIMKQMFFLVTMLTMVMINCSKHWNYRLPSYAHI